MTSSRVTIRECAGEDEEQVSLDIANAVWPHEAVTMDEVRSFKAATRDHADLLGLLDGAAVGSAVVAILPQRPDVGFVLATVLEEGRRRGVGTALYGDVSAWTAARGLDRLWAPAEEDDAGSLAFAARRGFVEIERNPRMVLDLASIGEPAIDPPPGVEIVTWAERPELAHGVYEVAVEAYADIPGAEEDEMESFEDWLAHDMHGSGDFPEATFLALAGKEVVGYAKFSLTAARPSVALHDLTGVRRAWRGRGIARALKCAQISWALRAGYERLETKNEVRNEPIRRLNDRLGYRLVPGRVLLGGPLAPSRARRPRAAPAQPRRSR